MSTARRHRKGSFVVGCYRLEEIPHPTDVTASGAPVMVWTWVADCALRFRTETGARSYVDGVAGAADWMFVVARETGGGMSPIGSRHGDMWNTEQQP